MFNKILCVKKTTKFERLNQSKLLAEKYVCEKLLKNW